MIHKMGMAPARQPSRDSRGFLVYGFHRLPIEARPYRLFSDTDNRVGALRASRWAALCKEGGYERSQEKVIF